MQLPRAGREYLRLTLTNVPGGADVEVSLDDGATWNQTTLAAGQYRLLVAGPDFPDPPDAVVVTASVKVRARIVDNPELILRGAGYVYLID